ncbi:MAG: hypothetical protein J5757_09065, partial [Lachnospiraceae bacterium]|nr:hypothetical protein [Lachnospiraceae bacterium]
EPMKRVQRIMLVALCLMLVSCKETDETETTLNTCSKKPMQEETGTTIAVIPAKENSLAEISKFDDTEPDDFLPENVTGEAFVCDEWIGTGFLTEDYVLYHDYDGRLRIFDVANKKDLIYCFDPGCEHKKSLEIEAGCISYNFTSMTVAILKEKMYFLDYNGDVVCSDLQGKNRRVIGNYPSYIPGRNFSFSEKDMFSTYFTSYEVLEVEDNIGEPQWIFGERKDKDTAGVVRVNLSSGKATEIFQGEGYNARVFYTGIRGEHLYFAYVYSEIPYMSPDGQTWVEIPDELKKLSVEEYLAEFNRRYHMDIYDYDIRSDELSMIIKSVRPAQVSFYQSNFAICDIEYNKTILYRYTGEQIRELNGVQVLSNYSDTHPVVLCDGEIQMIDENTGEVLKRLDATKPGVLYPKDFIGKSCYGYTIEEGVMRYFYISAQDYWNGEFEKAIHYNVE